MMFLTKSRHQAAIIDSIGQPFKLEERETPTPGPNELLIEVRTIALNHVDWAQRDFGYQVSHKHGISGHDIAGVVAAVGDPIAQDAPKAGARVAALSIAFYAEADPDYGAFQKYVIVPASNAFELPTGMGPAKAAALPMAVTTALTGLWDLRGPENSEPRLPKHQAILVWGASSSVGCAVVQAARDMGFIVYATASPANHQMIKSLGAFKVFDYNETNVVQKIISSVTEDGQTINLAYNAASTSSKPILEILSQIMVPTQAGRVVSAGPLDPEDPIIPSVDIKFVTLPDIKTRHQHVHQILTVWLKPRLESGMFVPSPKINVLSGGLEAINSSLDMLKAGVSGTKLVVEL